MGYLQTDCPRDVDGADDVEVNGLQLQFLNMSKELSTSDLRNRSVFRELHSSHNLACRILPALIPKAFSF